MIRNSYPTEVDQNKKKCELMKKLERERRQEDPNFEGFYREFKNDFARMSFMIRKEYDIIKMEMERRDAIDKGVKFEERPINHDPTVYKVKGHRVTVEEISPGTSRQAVEQVRKIEKGKAKLSNFLDIQDDFDKKMCYHSLPLRKHSMKMRLLKS